MKIALGVFDGVHRGHQKVIEKAHRIVTFDPHPNHGMNLLTTLEERQDLIGNLDVIKFNRRIAQLSPSEFIEEVLLKRYKDKLEAIIVGHDFAFGYNREGNVDILRKLGHENGFLVEEIPEYILDEHPVRSSSIRKLLAKGDILTANYYLGRDYQLTGKVIHGHGRGTELGFPTINLKVNHPNKLIPVEGVYAGEAIVDRKIFKTAIFIGTRKTFNEHEKVVEAHLINYHGNAYGKNVTLFFQKYLRPEIKFNNSTDLKRQIAIDVKNIGIN